MAVDVKVEAPKPRKHPPGVHVPKCRKVCAVKTCSNTVGIGGCFDGPRVQPVEAEVPKLRKHPSGVLID